MFKGLPAQAYHYNYIVKETFSFNCYILPVKFYLPVLCNMVYFFLYMDLAFFIEVLQVISAILLIIAILLVRSEAGVGGAFGGGDVSESGTAQRRGSEKILFIGTIVIAVVFVMSVALPLVV